MINYMRLISENHPEFPASCNGDPSVYGDIIFEESSVDKATLDSEWLDYYKKQKNEAIDKKTKELIAQGFVYNSVVFSTSETAQRNWMGIDQFSADLTYPFGVSTKDDGEYLLADAAEIHTFVLTAMGTLEYHYSTGRTLKQQINSATTEAEVDAVVDNR